ncbi:MAG: EpsG family protein [Clostridiales bacterium]|nr:EpsG family protein [Clostridiales bacterium]
MLIYYLLLVMVLALAYPLCIYKPSKIKKAAYISITFAYLLGLCVFRYGIGNDFFSYIKIFENISQTPFSDIFKSDLEIGFFAITKLITSLTMNTDVIYAVFALIILLPVAVVIYKHSDNIWLSCYLYICLTFYYTSFNFIRQSIAASIIFLGYRFIKEKKPLIFILFILLATTFHYTAIILLPIYLLSLIKPNKYLYLGYGVLTAIVFIFSKDILNFVLSIAPEKYRHYANSMFVTTGLSVVFLVIPFILLIAFILVYFLSDWKEKCKQSGIFTNFIFFNAIIWLFITKHFILERFSMYAYIFVILALPSLCENFNNSEAIKEKIKNAKNKDSKALKESLYDAKYIYKLVLCVALVPALLYNIFGMYDGTSGFHGIFPYKTNISAVYLSEYKKLSQEELNSKIRAEKDLYKYILEASQRENTLIILSTKGSIESLSSPVTSALKKLGFSGKLTAGKYDYNYIAIAKDNICLYEECSKDTLYTENKIEGIDLSIGSINEDDGTSRSQIAINGNDYSLNSWGLNIVIYDTATNKVIDCVTFNPYQKEAIRI